MKFPLACFVPLFWLFACRQAATQFEKLPARKTGIDFTNTITEDKEHNVLMYEYYYNGNGVAVGDINGDGLADVFFTGNQTPSKLYLNKGGFRFEDITAKAGVAGKEAWRTGVNMADVNGDGLLDIYVCYSGFGTDADRANQLYINNGAGKDGPPTFTESATAYGIDAQGTYSSQSVFFDYDRDGDLDMFLVNHAKGFYSPFFNTKRLRNLRHPQFGNRLYRNDANRFIEVSAEAGIYGSGINFGLGVAVSDLNGDGWPDIYVSNDFEEQDFCYLNNKNGTFKEVCQQLFAHISRSTMGIDIADYNNDGLPDLVTLDMLPESNARQKTLQGADAYDKYMLMVDSGYGHQNTRNMLQLHRGFTPDGMPVFSEVGQLAGVSNTDWSWASLFADFDNDGWKDLFVTNGFLRDYTDLDFVKYGVTAAVQQAQAEGKDISTRESYQQNMPLYELLKKMPSTRLSNYAYRNNRNLLFSNESVPWGLDEAGVSSGAAYADLDNDGDLDLIVCNNNDPAWVYKNNANELQKNNFIKVALSGKRGNKFGIGAKVFVITDSGRQFQEMYPVRGYQSSVDYVLTFGLGKGTGVKEVKVIWPDGSVTIINDPAINTTIVVSEKNAVPQETVLPADKMMFTGITASSSIDFIHKENPYVDFKREFLIPYQLSRQGPKMAKGDVNGDGLEDFFIGGAAGQSGALYLQTAGGRFKKSSSQPWQQDTFCEDINSLFFDADGDGDVDLYIVSGGSEWRAPGPELQDRLYKNDGRGNFTKLQNALPEEVYSGSCVSAADFDKDGDLDLFVGDRTVPGQYPLTGGNILLRNETDRQTGGIRFSNITLPVAGEPLFHAGMVTDAVWTDVDGDTWPDLVVVGDWMPVRIFHNERGRKLVDITEASGLSKSNGWWCKIVPADIDEDGDTDFIVGNMGTNIQFKCSEQEPLITYAADFNNDGRIDPIMTRYIQGVSYPFHSRDELVEQMPVFNQKFLKYSDFANATINEIATPEQIKKSKKQYIYHTENAVLVNDNGKFILKPLPVEAQFSMMSAVLYKDYDGDGREDILLAGNFYPFRVQQGGCDASLGSFLKGDGRGGFVPVDRRSTGLYVPGDVRDMIELKSGNRTVMVVSKNSDAVQVFMFQKEPAQRFHAAQALMK